MATPILGSMKANFDGSLQNNSATGGYILRDWKGELLKVRLAYYGHTSILVVEARALQDGVKEALAAGYRKLIIEVIMLRLLRH